MNAEENVKNNLEALKSLNAELKQIKEQKDSDRNVAEELAKIKLQLQNETDKFNHLKQDIMNKKQISTDVNQSLHQTLMEQKNKEITNLTTRVNQLTTNYKELEDRHKELHKTIDNVRNTKIPTVELNTIISEKDREITILAEKLHDLSKENHDLQSQLDKQYLNIKLKLDKFTPAESTDIWKNIEYAKYVNNIHVSSIKLFGELIDGMSTHHNSIIEAEIALFQNDKEYEKSVRIMKHLENEIEDKHRLYSQTSISDTHREVSYKQYEITKSKYEDTQNSLTKIQSQKEVLITRIIGLKNEITVYTNTTKECILTIAEELDKVKLYLQDNSKHVADLYKKQYNNEAFEKQTTQLKLLTEKNLKLETTTKQAQTTLAKLQLSNTNLLKDIDNINVSLKKTDELLMLLINNQEAYDYKEFTIKVEQLKTEMATDGTNDLLQKELKTINYLLKNRPMNMNTITNLKEKFGNQLDIKPTTITPKKEVSPSVKNISKVFTKSSPANPSVEPTLKHNKMSSTSNTQEPSQVD